MVGLFRAAAPKAVPRDLLTIYAMTGGLPRYLNMLAEAEALTAEKAVRYFFSGAGEMFRSDGLRCLADEFGIESPVYQDLLDKIVEGRTRWSELQEGNGPDVAAYLKRLEAFRIIRRLTPFASGRRRGLTRWEIVEPQFAFFLRFGRPAYCLGGPTTDDCGEFEAACLAALPQHLERVLKVWFRRAWLESGEWLEVGGWWERGDGSDVDMVAANPVTKTITFAEVKLDPEACDLKRLERTVERFLEAHPEYASWERRLVGLTLNDLSAV